LSILMAILIYIFLKGISIIFFAQSIAYLLAIVNKRLFDKFYEKLENSIFYPVHFVLLVIPLSFGIPFSYLSYVALGLRNITFTFIGLFPIIIFFASNYRDILPFDKKIISSFLIFLIIVLIVLITININFTEKKPIISTMTLSKDNDTSYFNIILPYNEVKYSNNPWYKSILSLGQVSKDKYNYIVYEISEIKLPKFEFIKILSTNETKTYKEYNLEIKSNSWNFTLPANSQVSIKNYINLNFNEISTLKGYTPFNKTIIIKIRIPLKEILKYKVMNPFYEEKYNFNIPKRPKEIIGYYDSIVETGTLK